MEPVDTLALTRAYINLRDARNDLRKKYEEEDGALKEKLLLVEGKMLEFLNDTKQDSAKNELGTFYKQEEVTPAGADWDAFYEWVVRNNAFEALEKRVKKRFIQDYMQTHDGAIPSGISVFREYVVRVRRS